MFLEVDYSKCNRDGLCVDECPARIIEMNDEGPSAVDGAEKICIHCGHCVAVCPEGALSVDFLNPDECFPIDESLQFDAQQAVHFLRSRRSIRTYRKKEVSRDLLKKVVTCASSAPTASNRQPLKWIILYQREKVRTVTSLVIDWMRYMVKHHSEAAVSYNMELLIKSWEDGLDRICRDAPHLIFTYTSKDVGSGKADCDTALAYLELVMPSFGLGSCWAGYVTNGVSQWLPLQEFLGIGQDEQLHGAIMAGYPKYKYQRVPRRNNPIITYI